MSKKKLSAEEKLNRVRQYQKGLEQAKEDLFVLFESGVPLGVLDDDFEEDQDFQWISDNWRNAINLFIESNTDYLSDICLRQLITKYLEWLPESKEVYWIHCPNYEFEAWVVGDLKAAQLCLKGKVEFQLELEPSCWYYTEEDIEFIRGMYEIERVTAETLKKRNKIIGAIELNRLNDIYEKLGFATGRHLIPNGCYFCMLEQIRLDANTSFCRKSLEVEEQDLISFKPFNYLHCYQNEWMDFFWPADCKGFVETLAVGTNAREG